MERGDKVLEWWKTSGHAQDLTFISQARLFSPHGGFGAMTVGAEPFDNCV